jgi:glycine cleavage system H protein
VGITFHAQDALGDVVFVTLPEVGATVTAGQPCGEVESTKSVSDIYAPVTGSITAVNPELEGTPELVNTDPYGQGWMFEVEISEAGVVDTLMSAERYRAQLG